MIDLNKLKHLLFHGEIIVDVCDLSDMLTNTLEWFIHKYVT